MSRSFTIIPLAALSSTASLQGRVYGLGHGALRNPAATGGVVPNVVGQGGSSHGPGQKIPGFGSSFGGAASLNQSNSGGRTGGMKQVPGFDISSAGAAGLNLPGGRNTRPGAGKAASGLAVNNPYDSRNNGGGSGNNSEQATGGIGQLDPGSRLQHIQDGDGAGTDAGENGNSHTFDGLAAGSNLARKDQGDGGSADSRGGGSASTLNGGALIRKPTGAGQRLVQAIGQ